MTYTDARRLSPETQSAVEEEVRTLLRVRVVCCLYLLTTCKRG